MQLIAAWADSARYFFSLSTWHMLGKSIVRKLPLALTAGMVLLAAVLLSVLPIPGISTFFRYLLSVPPPLIAVVGSPLYLLPLIRMYETTKKHHPWLPYILSGVWFYGTAGTLVWLCWHLSVCGPAWAVMLVTVVLTVLMPLFVLLLWCSPCVMLAYVYAPMATKGHRAIWHHGLRMSWFELPFIGLLLAVMMPFGFLVYRLPTLLVEYGYITFFWWRPLLHIGSVIYWLLGWGLFIVFYQARKKRYIETKARKGKHAK